MAENRKEEGCPQKDSAEHEEYVGASRSFRRIWEERNRVQPDRSTITNFRKKETIAKRPPSCENPYTKWSDGSNPIVALYQSRA